MTATLTETTRRTIRVVNSTSFGVVQENARCCGNRFRDVKLVGPVHHAPPGFWSAYEGQPLLRQDGEFCVGEWEGPADQLDGFAAEVALMDHYGSLHSSMRGRTDITPAQRDHLGTCDLCDL